MEISDLQEKDVHKQDETRWTDDEPAGSRQLQVASWCWWLNLEPSFTVAMKNLVFKINA